MTKRRNEYYMLLDKIDDIRKDYGILSIKEIENKYNVDYGYFRKFCSNNKIKSNRFHTYNKWTKCEMQMLAIDWRENILSPKELSQKYNRTYNSIKSKAKELKIKRITNVDKLNDEDIKNICEIYNDNIDSKKYLKNTIYVKVVF